jgi:flagellar basal-body rod protein FlgF
MDRALYIAMTGATQTLKAQAVNHHNLANASTVGFRAELTAANAVAVEGQGFASRIGAQNFVTGTDDRAGNLQSTGRALDVAFRDDGWLAVQAADGSEQYTRAGDLTLDANGALRTAGGALVLGDGGPIAIAQATSLNIGADGTISMVPSSGGTASINVGKLKVVSAKAEQLERSGNGLFKAKKGVTLEAKTGATCMSGTLESSNVNAADALVTMIELARNFELQTRAMKSADEQAQQAASLVRMK